MKQTVYFDDFVRPFEAHRPHDFTRPALVALFDFLEEYEDSTGETIEFDMIALCCDFTEYRDVEEFQGDYSADYNSIEDIEEQTTVIRIPDSESFIIQAF